MSDEDENQFKKPRLIELCWNDIVPPPEEEIIEHEECEGKKVYAAIEEARAKITTFKVLNIDMPEPGFDPAEVPWFVKYISDIDTTFRRFEDSMKEPGNKLAPLYNILVNEYGNLYHGVRDAVHSQTVPVSKELYRFEEILTQISHVLHYLRIENDISMKKIKLEHIL